MIRIKICFLVVFLFFDKICAVENYKYFGQFQSLRGFTGHIFNPSCDILNKKNISLGLNKFNVGITYGAFENFETGISFNLKELSPVTALDSENLRRKSDEISINSKLRVLDQIDYDFGLSVGHRRSAIYCVVGKYFPDFYGLGFESGIDIRYWLRPEDKIKFFLTFIRTSSSYRFIFTYEERNSSLNFGWRFLLSPEVVMDLFLVDALRYKAFFDNVYYGVSIIWR